MTSFSITNTQGIVSKAALAGQMQDGANRGHELASEHASQNMRDEHAVNLEKVSETNKPEESMDRDANPEDTHNKESEEDTTEDETEEGTDDKPFGQPDSSGHIDFTV